MKVSTKMNLLDINVLVNSATNVGEIGNLTLTVHIGHLSIFKFAVYSSTSQILYERNL